jgi:hypothetical protein
LTSWKPSSGTCKKAGCAASRSILIIVWHLLNDPAARYRDLGSGWHARHTHRSRKARNAQRQPEALGYDVIITLREDAACTGCAANRILPAGPQSHDSPRAMPPSARTVVTLDG